MRNQITQIGLIASKSANKIYDDKIELFLNEIKQQEGKEVFVSTLLLRGMADLFGLLGGDFEDHIDMLVGIAKQQASEARLIQHSDSRN